MDTHPNENRPGADTEAASTSIMAAGRWDGCHSTAVSRQLRARRTASWRLPILNHSGRADPWHYDPPTAGYPEATAHLLSHGLTPAPNLPAMRLMWQHGGDQQRLAIEIAQRWEVAS